MRAAVQWLVGALVLPLAVACRGDEPTATVESPTPELSASAVATPDESSSDEPGDAPSASASPSPSDDAGAPDDTDRARFVSAYRPEDASDLEHVQVDVDGDGVDELVFSYVRGGEKVGHVDVADWNPELEAYEVVAGADGGIADRIDRIRVGDLNADGRVEVALFQASGSSGASVTLWAVLVPDRGAPRLVPLRARGGCWDGSSTYGVIGAEIDERDGDGIPEVYATCDDSPLPVAAWSTDGYRWQDGSYVHDPAL